MLPSWRRLAKAAQCHFTGPLILARSKFPPATKTFSSTSTPHFFSSALLLAMGFAAGTASCDRSHLNEDEPVSEFLQDLFYVAPSSESRVKIFTGTANPQLATEIAMHLGTQLGRATVKPFADGEIQVHIHDNVRGKKVYLVQSTTPPVDKHLMELLLMITAMRRASAKEITAVIPYFGYSRSTQSLAGHRTVAGADVARMLEVAGVDRIVAVDLHRGQMQGFFSPKVPVDNLDISGVAVPYLQTKFLYNPVVVSPDANGTQRAKSFRDRLLNHGMNASFAVVVDSKSPADDEDTKYRKQGHTTSDSKVYELVGDVKGRDVVIIDDIVDSGRRISRTAHILKQRGAKRIFAFASHGLFTGKAVEIIEKSPVIEMIVLNTVPLDRAFNSPKILQLSASALLAEAIRRIHSKTSVSELMR